MREREREVEIGRCIELLFQENDGGKRKMKIPITQHVAELGL